ncbi:Protein of unknown function [Pyronema omphalodes CBS 100304]|uniref:Uncharacterized protein n=1 Tax=Pyronema omphalodes (strain CBS 100304) TaxID=1076935 RepID=U4LN39_PYROM|nr:Protein of unknown function [Pyronema omphalodes CBS 100304]
MNSLPTLL